MAVREAGRAGWLKPGGPGQSRPIGRSRAAGIEPGAAERIGPMSYGRRHGSATNGLSPATGRSKPTARPAGGPDVRALQRGRPLLDSATQIGRGSGRQQNCEAGIRVDGKDSGRGRGNGHPGATSQLFGHFPAHRPGLRIDDVAIGDGV
jgi:hypothetical protein